LRQHPRRGAFAVQGGGWIRIASGRRGHCVGIRLIDRTLLIGYKAPSTLRAAACAAVWRQASTLDEASQASIASRIARCSIASVRAMTMGLLEAAGPSATMTANACRFQSTTISARAHAHMLDATANRK
jgi:hypothetical protein